MKCEWDALLSLLSPPLKTQMDLTYCKSAQELRLRIGQAAQCVCSSKTYLLKHTVSSADLQFCINAATRYSPWISTTAQYGYITAPGGHRIGLCGEYTDGKSVLSSYTSMCIRIARDFSNISERADPLLGSVLIIGKPGVGKTTLLRDLIRRRSNHGPGSVAVIDERRELFPLLQGCYCFEVGSRTDILSGISKVCGIDIALRSLGPSTIALDEITAEQDCQALQTAAWCGVDLLATAHASCVEDLKRREIYRPILENKLFNHVLILHEDKSWVAERIDQCTSN